jgi:hypothetical protein
MIFPEGLLSVIFLLPKESSWMSQELGWMLPQVDAKHRIGGDRWRHSSAW